jgi:uncharacterized protein (DUF2141 family)
MNLKSAYRLPRVLGSAMGIIGIFISSISTGPEEMVQLTLKVENVKTETGALMIAVYNNPSDFLSETMYKGLKEKVSDTDSKSYSILLPKGDYAIAIYHDLNSNEEMDRNMFFLPVEPYGFSNNAKAVFRPPSWKDAVFQLDTDRVEVVVLGN